ncbi:MAG: LysR family transcriptional regulator [Bdellovibrionales bacterium]|nr:LysR family transcriptional regulator [Bdellovibrionales bacterium]
MLNLNNDQLAAFTVLCRSRSFSKAAKELNITQPSLSKRIAALEEQLNLTLIERSSRSLNITRQGDRLLQYTDIIASLEIELFADLGLDISSALSGSIRVESKSTLITHLVIPSLSSLIRNHPYISIDFQMNDFPFLSNSLKEGRTDMALNWQPIDSNKYENIELGKESYSIAIRKNTRPDFKIFLDANPDDPITTEFFRQKKKSLSGVKRLFLNNNEGIIQGINSGLGVAILEDRVIEKYSDCLTYYKSKKEMMLPVYLQYRKQKAHSKLLRKCIDLIILEAKQYFSDFRPKE